MAQLAETRPDYAAASLADVLPSLLAAIGVSLADHPPALAAPPGRAAAVLLVDGLGHELLAEYAADAPVLAGMADAGPIAVGFPSTTPISLTSLGTGLPPGAHGTLGLSMRVDGQLLDTLTWTEDRRDVRDRVVPEQVQPTPTVLERAAAAGVAVRVVSGREFRTSGLTRSGLRGGEYRGVHALGDLAHEILAGLAGPGPCLVYGYHADLDKLGHLYGPGSHAWRWQLRQVDGLVGMLLDALPAGALLAVTGDHGMVTVDRIHDADRTPALQDGVALLGGDPRSRHVYAEPGATGDVLAAWSTVLGDDAWVLGRDDAVARGWFGPVSDRLRDRIGDVVVALRGTAAVVRSDADPFLSALPGQHGSLTAAEQLVPVLLASPR